MGFVGIDTDFVLHMVVMVVAVTVMCMYRRLA